MKTRRSNRENGRIQTDYCRRLTFSREGNRNVIARGTHSYGSLLTKCDN